MVLPSTAMFSGPTHASSEASSVSVGTRGASNDHATRDLALPVSFYSSNESPESGFRFVDDLGSAIDQARHEAGDGDVSIGGGADVIRQALAAGRVDELVISTAPVILGAGKRLFEGFDRDVDLEVVRVYSSPYATHVRYSVAR